MFVMALLSFADSTPPSLAVCTENLNPRIVVMKAARIGRELMIPVR
jgi:hypothetical protein